MPDDSGLANKKPTLAKAVIAVLVIAAVAILLAATVLPALRWQAARQSVWINAAWNEKDQRYLVSEMGTSDFWRHVRGWLCSPEYLADEYESSKHVEVYAAWRQAVDGYVKMEDVEDELSNGATQYDSSHNSPP